MNNEELEQLKEKIAKKKKTKELIIGIIHFNMLLICLLLNYYYQLDIFILFGSMFICLILLFVTYKILNTIFSVKKEMLLFQKLFKELHIQKSMNYFFDDLIYNPESGFDEEEVYSNGLIEKGLTYLSCDLYTGLYRNIPMRQSSILTEDMRECYYSDGERKKVLQTVHNSRYMIFDFPKYFKTDFKVFFVYDRNQEREDIMFEKYYLIGSTMVSEEWQEEICYLSDKKDEIYQVLTPKLIDFFSEFANNFGHFINIAFIGNQLHIVIEGFKNYIKPKVEYEYEEEQYELYSNIQLVLDFVSALSSEDNAFKE